MNIITGKSFTRTLSATAVAAALALSLGTGYAADAKPEAAKSAETTLPVTAATPAETAQPATEAKNEPVRLTDRETVTQFEGWEDPDMARVAEHSGRALLRHVQAAHAALEQNKLGEARSDLAAAEDFAEGLQIMVPYSVVMDHIRNDKHELLASSTGIIVDDMLPIYSNLDEMAEFAPELAKTAKSKLDLASQHAQKARQAKTGEELDEVAADISTTTVYLPVMYVEHQVETARNALNNDPANLKIAKAAIDNAQMSLVHATVNMHIFPVEKGTARTSAPAKAPAPAETAVKTG